MTLSLPPLEPTAVSARDCAFLFDLDGTLLDIAPMPDDVRVAPGLLAALKRLQTRADGALAVVSGRRVAFIDRLLPGLDAPLAGVHGLELRLGAGQARGETKDGAAGARGLAALRDALGFWLRVHPGVVVEDKGLAIALHFRADPSQQPHVESFAARFAARPDQGLHIQRGKMVVEIRELGPNKGDAVHTIMKLPEFQRRRPIYFGDDVTDEDAFVAAAGLGGLGVFVGVPARPTEATVSLPSPRDVHRFIDRLALETQPAAQAGHEKV